MTQVFTPGQADSLPHMNIFLNGMAQIHFNMLFFQWWQPFHVYKDLTWPRNTQFLHHHAVKQASSGADWCWLLTSAADTLPATDDTERSIVTVKVRCRTKAKWRRGGDRKKAGRQTEWNIYRSLCTKLNLTTAQHYCSRRAWRYLSSRHFRPSPYRPSVRHAWRIGGKIALGSVG